MLSLSGILRPVAKGLSKNSEALLVFGLGLIALGLVQMGVNNLLACAMPLVLYILYIARQEKSERDMAQFDLERLEASRSAALAKTYAKTLSAQSASEKKAPAPKVKK